MAKESTTRRLEKKWQEGASPLQILNMTPDIGTKSRVITWLGVKIKNELPAKLDGIDITFVLSDQFELLRDGCKNIKIRNKATGRCVKLQGAIGQQILKRYRQKHVVRRVDDEGDDDDGYVTPDEFITDEEDVQEAVNVLFTPVKPRIMLPQAKIKQYIQEVLSNAREYGGMVWTIVQRSLSFFQSLLRDNANGDLWAVFTLMCFQIILQSHAKQEDAGQLVKSLHFILRPLINDKFLVWTNIFYFISKTIPYIGTVGKWTKATYSWIYIANVMIRILLYVWKNFFVVAGVVLKNGELSKGL